MSNSKSTIMFTAFAILIIVSILGSFTVGSAIMNGENINNSDIQAGKFNFNQKKDKHSGERETLTWNIDNLGATSSNSNGANLYPGANGQFALDVCMSSDYKATATAQVELQTTGAFSKNMDVFDSTSFKVVITKTKYDSIDQVPFEAKGVALSEFADVLQDTLTKTVGDNGRYVSVGNEIETTVYVYWQWPFSAGTDEQDTLFANYVSAYKMQEEPVDSVCGITVSMTVEMD